MEFSDVPLWPNKGVPPAEIAEKYYVYADIATGEYVLYYPENLGHGEEPLSATRITERFELQNRVDPIIRVQIEQADGEQLKYSYTLTNGANGHHAIRYWSLVAQADDDSTRLSHPKWNHYVPRVPQRHCGRPSRPAFRPGPPPASKQRKFIDWTAREEADRVPPGVTAGRFEAISSLRSGWTTAYAVGGQSLRLKNTPPVDVMKQLGPLLKPESNWKTVLTIGPKFDSKVVDAWIANDWAFGIRRSIVARRLSADSPFVQETLALLDVLAPGGDAPRRVRAEPKTVLEKEIAQSLLYSLDMRKESRRAPPRTQGASSYARTSTIVAPAPPSCCSAW